MALRRRRKREDSAARENSGPAPGDGATLSKIFEGDLRGAAGHAVVHAAALLTDARGQMGLDQAAGMVGEAQAWMQWAALVLEHEEALAGSGGLIGLYDTMAKVEAHIADHEARLDKHLAEHHSHEALEDSR